MSDMKIGDLSKVSFKGGETPKHKDKIGFSKALKGAINRVNKLEREANQSIIDLLKGKADVHETMIALQKADISMRLLLTIRNKVVDAYREIMHMQF